MIKLSNKKGQGGFGLTTLLEIIAGVVLLVLIVLSFTTFFKTINVAKDTMSPSTLSFFNTRCSGVATTPSTYCDFKEGDLEKAGKVLINCQFVLVQDDLKQTSPESVAKFNCNAEDLLNLRNNFAKNACGTNNADKKISLNGSLTYTTCGEVLKIGTTTQKLECPSTFECCSIDDPQYKEKACADGRDCQQNKCVG